MRKKIQRLKIVEPSPTKAKKDKTEKSTQRAPKDQGRELGVTLGWVLDEDDLPFPSYKPNFPLGVTPAKWLVNNADKNSNSQFRLRVSREEAEAIKLVVSEDYDKEVVDGKVVEEENPTTSIVTPDIPIEKLR